MSINFLKMFLICMNSFLILVKRLDLIVVIIINIINYCYCYCYYCYYYHCYYYYYYYYYYRHYYYCYCCYYSCLDLPLGGNFCSLPRAVKHVKNIVLGPPGLEDFGFSNHVALPRSAQILILYYLFIY